MTTSLLNGTHQCPKCNHAPFSTPQGLAMHDGRVHTGKIRVPREGHTRRFTPDIGSPKPKRKYTRRAHLNGHLLERPKRKYTRRTFVEKVLERHASAHPVSIHCPICTYDFTPLKGSKVHNRFCPGCGTSFQTLIEKLQAVIRA